MPPDSTPCLVTVTCSPVVSHSSRQQTLLNGDATKTCSLGLLEPSVAGSNRGLDLNQRPLRYEPEYSGPGEGDSIARLA